MIRLSTGLAITVPVNVAPLIDDTDFKTRETAIAFDAAGMDLVWNFLTPAGVITQTAVTPTSAGNYDWTHVGDGMYKIEIPASGGASINNNAVGWGWFSGFVTGVLPFVGPMIAFQKLVGTVVEDDGAIFAGTAAAIGAQSITKDASDDMKVGDVVLIFPTDSLDNQERQITADLGSGQFQTDRAWDPLPGSPPAYRRYPSSLGPTIEETVDAVHDEPLSEHTTAGTFAKAVADIETDVNAVLVDTDSTLQNELDAIQADVEDLQTRVPAALVGGRIDASVGAMGAGVLTAAAIGADAITAAKVAADVGTEIGAAVLAAAAADPIHANMEEINTVPLVGDGSATPFNV